MTALANTTQLSIREVTGLTADEQRISAETVASLTPSQEVAESYVHRDIKGVYDFDVLDFARAEQLNILLSGPTGSAKSHLFRAYGAARRMAVATVSCNGASDPTQWFGSYRPIPNDSGGTEFIWCDGIITAALRSGGVVFLDEINFLRPDIAASLHQLLRERELILLDKGNEVVKAHPNTLICAALNIGSEYTGVAELNAALQNRFALQIEWDYDPKVEAQLIENRILRRLSDALRLSVQEGALSTPCPTNALQEFEVAATRFGTDWAISAFVCRYRADERLVVEEQIRLLELNNQSWGE